MFIDDHHDQKHNCDYYDLISSTYLKVHHLLVWRRQQSPSAGFFLSASLSGRPLGVGTRWSCGEDTAHVESTVLTIGWILPVNILLWAASCGWHKPVVVMVLVVYVSNYGLEAPCKHSSLGKRWW